MRRRGFVLPQRHVGWDELGYVSRLERFGPVAIAEPRGYGDAARHDEYPIDGLCEDMLAAADDAGIDDVVAVGYSNSAGQSMLLALRSPRVVGLVCGGFDPLLDLRFLIAHAEAQEAEGAYLDGATFDWKAIAATCRGIEAWQVDPTPLGIPSVIVYGSDDGAMAPSLAVHRLRLEALGFTVTQLDGLDHGTCVEAVDRVLGAARAVIEPS